MTEPPKPITRLAEPIDRSGPRGPNRLGEAAAEMCFWTWAAGIVAVGVSLHLVAIEHDWAPASTALWLPTKLCLWICPLVLVASVVLAIVAMCRAGAQHLRLQEAVCAIAWFCIGLALWALLAAWMPGAFFTGF